MSKPPTRPPRKARTKFPPTTSPISFSPPRARRSRRTCSGKFSLASRSVRPTRRPARRARTCPRNCGDGRSARAAARCARAGSVWSIRCAPPRRGRSCAGRAGDARRVQVRSEDFRIVRFRQRRGTTAIFVVDASGSSAMQRLAEVKGAIELLLVDCYVRRDSVALVAFRGEGAEVILPPTRSLARAKRTLAGLPGGGGTPIAHGLEAALALADRIKRQGQTTAAGADDRRARQCRPRRRAGARAGAGGRAARGQADPRTPASPRSRSTPRPRRSAGPRRRRFASPRR